MGLSTVPNYLKAMKLFCEMNDIHVSWKKISRGVPRGRQAANDRAPTREEIQRLLEYPDRRIKPIVYTMISSGIRIGAWDLLKLVDGKESIFLTKFLTTWLDRLRRQPQRIDH
jgi:integrase